MVYNLLPFELIVLPLWLDRFVINKTEGLFSYNPWSQEDELYGSLDVVHVFYATGRLSTEKNKLIWAQKIQNYQNTSGWFLPKNSNNAPGWQPWHGSASATTTLKLLDTVPKHQNLYVQALAKSNNTKQWSAEFDPLYDSACYKQKLAGNNIHKCGQRIGSYPAILQGENKPILSWWIDWLKNKTDPQLGVLCPVQNSTYALIECIGGAQPTHGVEIGLGLITTLPYVRALLEFTLNVQNMTGGTWSDSDDFTQLGSLSLDGIFQVTTAALQLNTTQDLLLAENSCRSFLDIAVPQLNEPEIVFSRYTNTSHDLPNIVLAVAQCLQTFRTTLEAVTLNQWQCCPVYV
mmetsp:Transcript_13892/g.20848  ORF Transcript_13892/g.20848 Transcript_13892/m.20848 type:complete len:347 (+) Transcript_13892:25-1065(+)